MKCIYTVFYKNLKSYDGDDTQIDNRVKLLELSIKSFRICNPDIDVIVDYVEDVINNTADMYFDKMRRIKDKNKEYDVLWVDGDTICLENVSDIFSNKMRAVFWGWWDGLNLINGGVVYYPRLFLYDRWDIFVTDWVNMLSKLNMNGDKFVGPMEQMPITNLLLSQLQSGKTSVNHSLYDNYSELIKLGILLDGDYNYNPLVMNKYNGSDNSYNRYTNVILNKKILHINMSVSQFNKYFHTANYIVDNLIGYTHNEDKLKKRSDELCISNNYLNISNDNNEFKLVNNTCSTIIVYFYKNDELNLNKLNLSLSVRYKIDPGHYVVKQNEKENIIVIKNVLSGESVIFSQ